MYNNLITWQKYRVGHPHYSYLYGSFQPNQVQILEQVYALKCILFYDKSLILCHLLSEQQKSPSLTRLSQGWEGEMEGWIEDYRAVD